MRVEDSRMLTLYNADEDYSTPNMQRGGWHRDIIPAFNTSVLHDIQTSSPSQLVQGVLYDRTKSAGTFQS